MSDSGQPRRRPGPALSRSQQPGVPAQGTVRESRSGRQPRVVCLPSRHAPGVVTAPLMGPPRFALRAALGREGRRSQADADGNDANQRWQQGKRKEEEGRSQYNHGPGNLGSHGGLDRIISRTSQIEARAPLNLAWHRCRSSRGSRPPQPASNLVDWTRGDAYSPPQPRHPRGTLPVAKRPRVHSPRVGSRPAWR